MCSCTLLIAMYKNNTLTLVHTCIYADTVDAQATPSKEGTDSEKPEKKKKKGFLSFGKKDKEKKAKDK